MPKHTIEIPCSVGDKIRVRQGYYTPGACVEAVVHSVTVNVTNKERAITVSAKTENGDLRRYIWGKSAFELEGE